MQSIIPPIDIPAVREFQPESLEDTLPRLREMTLLFCPDTDEARGVMDRLRSWDHGRPGPRPRVHGFATEADMVEYNHQLALSGGPNASAATTSKDASADGLGPMAQVVGLSFTSLTRGTVSYTIRMQQETAPQLDRWKTPAQGGAEANESRCETLSFSFPLPISSLKIPSDRSFAKTGSGHNCNGCCKLNKSRVSRSTVLASDLLRSGFVMLEHALNEVCETPSSFFPRFSSLLRFLKFLMNISSWRTKR
jgi:hypothetical protein